MNFINRAFKNVTRKLSKTILLIITFFVIGNLVIIGLGVASAAENAKTLTRKKMRAVVNYNVDYEAFYEYAESIEDEQEREEVYNHYPKIKISDVQNLLADERVATANALVTSQGYLADGYTYVKLNNEAEANLNDSGQQCWIMDDGSQSCSDYIEAMHYIKANMFPDMIEFVDGGYSIVDGRFYNQDEIDNGEYVVVISKAFAEVNNLRVGDKYSFYTISPNEFTWMPELNANVEDFLYDYEVVGIFDHQSKITPDSSNFEYSFPSDNPDNMLFMPGTTLSVSRLKYEQILFDYYATQFKDDEYYSNPENRPNIDDLSNVEVYDVTLLLNDPLDVDNFIEDYKDNLPEFMKLDANNEEFDRLAKPLDTLSLYANFIIWLVVINAIIIISLVTALTLKTREYEIGVLLSIGASKFKVVAQFFIELALVAIIGFTLAIGSGSLVANKVGQKVLEYQIQEDDLDDEGGDFGVIEDYIWDTDYSTDITLDDLVSEYSVSISPLIIGEIYILGLGIVLVSIIVPSMMIMRFNPKRILMNQY